VANGRGDSNSEGLEHLAAGSLALSADGKSFVVLFKGDLLEGLEVLLDVRPLETVAGGFDAPIEFRFEGECKETAEHMTTDRAIALMKHRAGLKKRLGISEDLLDQPEILVLQGHLRRRKLGVGGEHPLAVKTLLLFDFIIVDGKSSVFRLETAPVAAVSNEPFGALSELFFKGSQDGLAIRFILARLFGIEAKDVAPAVYRNLSDLQRHRIFQGLPFRVNLPVSSGTGEHFLAHLLYLPHAHPQDVREPRFRIIESLEGFFADHPPVGHKAETGDRETFPNPLGNGKEGLDIHGVSRPHLTTKGSALAVEDRSHDHLLEIRPVILAEPVFSQTLSSLAFEVKGGRIEEDQIESGEQMALAVKKTLLDEVLDTTRRKGCGIPLILGFFTQESHGPVEVMERKLFHASDDVVSSPSIAKPVRTTNHESVKHGQKNGPLHIKAEQPVCQKAFKDLSYAQFFPETLEDQSRTNFPGFRQQFALPGQNQQGLLRKPGQGAHQTFDVTFGVKPIHSAERGNDSLHHLGSFPAIFHNLEVLVWA
jgi:hypothetical protein